ncbi:MAG: virulence RhuM family protein [Cryomorphaceae bacterium]|jgi:hypothetical protein|nr:virulence RhuM family protein [Cryomorphaceae bacterium]
MKNEIIIYHPHEAAEHIEVHIENQTFWLNQEQIAALFQRDQYVISRHIRNVFKEEELDEKSTMQKMHIPKSDKLVAFYNLDVIISVDYRVKSKQGTQFRIRTTAHHSHSHFHSHSHSEFAAALQIRGLPSISAEVTKCIEVSTHLFYRWMAYP